MRKPRPILINAIARAIERSRKLPADDIKILKRITADSLEAVKHGDGRKDDLSNLIDALNTAEELSGLGICSDANSTRVIQNGHDALVRMYRRHKERGSYEHDTDDINALDYAVFIHNVQLDHCSMGEYEKAAGAVKNKIAQALAGNKPKGAEVLS